MYSLTRSQYLSNCKNIQRNVLASITLIILLIIIQCCQKASSLLCYSCVSTQPGCTLEQVNWLIYSAISCPEYDDKCVKIIEQRGSEIRVTRDCLSNIMPFRDDVPADHFEGCRPATDNPKRAVFVDNAMAELDLKKNHFTNTTYCFCEFDQWCNGSRSAIVAGSNDHLINIFLITFFVSVFVKIFQK